MGWTKDQQSVIDARGGNLLVSAAAGSGKTAVLVERVIAMLMDESNPIEIDRLLIVTFTNAAAAEMRERIGQAIEEQLEKEPENEHLMKQLVYIHRAQITTIHSFCLNVIRNHFNLLDIDPNFRISEEAELSLIKSDVLSEVMEEGYQEADDDFLKLVESYSTGKTDKAIEELILQLYDFSRSYPRPKEWLRQAYENFNIQDETMLGNSPFILSLLDQTKVILDELVKQVELALFICRSENGPIQYEKTLLSDEESLSHLCECSEYEEYQEAFANFKFARLSGRVPKEADEKKKEMVKGIRDDVKASVGELKEKYYLQTAEEVLLDLERVRPSMKALIERTIAFDKKLQETKISRNIVDFGDLEHYALELLIDGYDESGRGIPSAVAEELSEFYSEIMIDEYQDSNFTQEEILNSISKEKFGQKNIFMVGDVKQSIYKFRLARPDLFLQKYDSYQPEGDQRKIELKKNFRSRASVLESINHIFYQLMGKDLGGIEYTKDVALIPGLEFPECNGTAGGKTELLAVDLAVDLNIETSAEIDDVRSEFSKKEIEAKLAAQRIKELMDPQNPHYVMDKKTGEYRVVTYSDIVILLRTVNGWADVFEEVLIGEGIPAHCDSQKGYFSAVEVQNVLSLLAVVDNVYLDIPMTAVLHSPMVKMSGEDLAVLKSFYPKGDEGGSFYDYLQFYKEDGEEGRLKDKVVWFLDLLEQMRYAKTYLSIHDLIWMALEKTGYYHYAGAMQQGKKRQGNLLMLIEKGSQYEATSYKGLFHFIRYMNQLKEYDIDFGEAKILGEGEDLVRIMSIHKSKGLEFPVVFVSGLAKRFNQMDQAGRVLIHPDYFIGPDCIDPEIRTKSPTLMKTIIQRNTMLETLAEELRILYVALTRAKEKLILTAAVDDWDKNYERLSYIKYSENMRLSYHTRIKAKSYLDWILSSLIRPQEWIDIKVTSIGEFVISEMAEAVNREKQKEALESFTVMGQSEIREKIRDQFQWSYRFEKEMLQKSKYSVSEVKKAGQEIDQEDAQLIIPKGSIKKYPQFIKKEEVSGAAKGTAVHKFLQLLNFEQVSDAVSIRSMLEDLVEKQVIEQEYLELIPVKGIATLLKSNLGKRIIQAEQDKRLFKEVQFVLGMPMNEVDETTMSDEMILMQGIIDLYFEQDDGLVLVDYKTDWVERGNAKALADRYKTQLVYYKKALEQITGKKVKETYIWSFGLNCAISV